MRRIVGLGLAAALVMFGLVSVQAAGSEATPVRVALIPAAAVPGNQVVHGLDLGLIADNVDEVQGLQACWIYSGTKEKLVGVQWGFVTVSNSLTGVQLGFVNKAKSVTGLQYGFYNGAENVTGLQFGFINSTVTMKGIQIGLVNIIKKGSLPFMVIVNGSF